jgi:C1A family cysteine protease
MRKAILVCCVLLLTKISWSQVIYTFNGNGKWSDSNNWVNKLVPPKMLNNGLIIIDPIADGECMLDTLQLMLPGANIEIKSGKHFILKDNVVINPPENSLGLEETSLDSLETIPILDTSKHLRPNKKSFPSTFELSIPTENDLPLIADQGSLGSCTSFAAAYATRSYYLHRDHCTTFSNSDPNYLTKVFSPSFIHNFGLLGKDCLKLGLNFKVAFRLMKNHGVCTWKKMPYNASDCSSFPDDEQIKNAELYKIDEYERLIDISNDFIKYILNSGDLVMCSIRIDTPFWKSGRFIWNKKDGEFLKGTHAVVICGYDDGKKAYKIMNSWGPAWGYNGFGWVDYNFLKAVIIGTKFPTSTPDFGNWEMFVMKTSPRFAVNFKTDPEIIVVDKPVTFTDLTEPEPTSREWSFQDGEPSSSKELHPSVIFSKGGKHNVTLKVFACSSYSTIKDSMMVVATKPILTTKSISSITENFAISGGIISDDGGASITEHGVCWSTSPNPSITSVGISKLGAGNGNVNFLSIISNLDFGIKYHVRAYATNIVGTAYGNEINFETGISQNSYFRGTYIIGGTSYSIDFDLDLLNGTGKIIIPEGPKAATAALTGSSLIVESTFNYSYPVSGVIQNEIRTHEFTGELINNKYSGNVKLTVVYPSGGQPMIMEGTFSTQ